MKKLIVTGIVLAAAIVFIGMYHRAPAKEKMPTVIVQSASVGAQKPTADVPETVKAPEYGHFKVKAGVGEGRRLKVEVGDNIIAVPVEAVAYDWYVDRTLFKKVQVDGNAKVVNNVSPLMTSVGYGLPAAGQTKTEVEFVYCLYHTQTPPADWFVQGLKTLRR